MSEKKIIDLEVKSNIQKTITELNNLESELKDVRQESGKTKKSIDDVASNGGAIAILDQLTGGLATRFKDAYESTKLFNISLKGMKSALIATGIGALVVALGVVVAYWDDILEFVKGTNKELERQNELIEFNRGVLDKRLKLLQDEKKYNEENSISNEKLISQEKQLLSAKMLGLKTELDNLEINYKKEVSLAAQRTIWERFTGQQATVNEEEAKALSEKQLKLLELQAELKNTQNAYDELGLVTITGSKGKGDAKSEKDRKVDSVGSVPTAEEQEAENIRRQKYFAKVFDLEAINKQALIDLNKNALLQIGQDSSIADAQRTENERQNAEARQKIAEIEFQSKQRTLGLTAQGLGQLSNILGQETGKGKALAVAAALIDTYAAIAGQLRAFSKVPIPGFAIAQAVVTGLSGFAAVKNILKVKVPNSSAGGSVNMGSMPAQTAQTPSFNIVGQSNVNQLADVIAGQDKKPIKAYVVSNDITTAQSLDRNIVKGATI